MNKAILNLRGNAGHPWLGGVCISSLGTRSSHREEGLRVDWYQDKSVSSPESPDDHVVINEGVGGDSY